MVMKAIQQRTKLKRPESAPEHVYEVMLACWKIDSHARMASSDILTSIEDYAATKGWSDGYGLTWPNDGESGAKNNHAFVLSQSLADLAVSRDVVEFGKELG